MNKKLSEMKANRAKNTPHCNRPSAIYIFTRFSEKTSPGYFPLGFFFLSCVSPIKPKRGGSSYTVENLLHISLARRTRRLNFLYER